MTQSSANGALPEPEELRRRAAELLRLWRVLDTEVEVAWNRRLTTTIGRAFVRNGLIELNPTLLARAPHEVDPVLIHETAHIAAFRLFGPNIQDHGRHWRSLMRLAGAEPAITHDLPVDDLRRSPPPRRRRYLYLRMCDGCGDRVVLERVRYGRCPGCDRRGDYLVVRSSASASGRRALMRMSAAEVRAHFA